MTSDFEPTRWTLVMRARGNDAVAKAALSDLCAAYYAPVVGFLRRECPDADRARETAHMFFEAVLESGVGVPEQGRGRFRSYLLGRLKHFMANRRAAGLAAKRGGGAEHFPLDDETDGLSVDPPDWVFDREWAFTLIGRALADLEREYASKPDVFAALKPWLNGGECLSQAEMAANLGISGTAVKVALHRIRARFRDLILAEVASTVYDKADAAGELRHLLEIVARGGDAVRQTPPVSEFR